MALLILACMRLSVVPFSINTRFVNAVAGLAAFGSQLYAACKGSVVVYDRNPTTGALSFSQQAAHTSLDSGGTPVDVPDSASSNPSGCCMCLLRSVEHLRCFGWRQRARCGVGLSDRGQLQARRRLWPAVAAQRVPSRLGMDA
jgi:hypothetical protein